AKHECWKRSWICCGPKSSIGAWWLGCCCCWRCLGLGPTVGVGLLGALLFAVAVGRLDQVLVDFADRHRRPEEGAGLGAGKVHRHVQLLRLDRLQLELLVLVDEDGCVLGAAVLQLGDQLGLQALVGGVVVVAVELVDVADDGLALVADGPLLDLGCRPLLLALEQGDQRLQDLLQLVDGRRLGQLLAVVQVLVDAVVAAGGHVGGVVAVVHGVRMHFAGVFDLFTARFLVCYHKTSNWLTVFTWSKSGEFNTRNDAFFSLCAEWRSSVRCVFAVELIE
uniref:Uncharacterized protein n=1 Tax=Anopheles atroparvus TaxID=41427 RepID=A0AAG5DMF1_ANOAO